MPFVVITTPSVGDATKQSFASDVKDDLDFLNSVTATSSRVNILANGSFEVYTGNDPDSWTVTDFTGGSHTIDTTNYAHGAVSLKFTITNATFGGGEATTPDYYEVRKSGVYYLSIKRMASAVNITSNFKIIWYDNTQTSISTTTIYTDTSTPTSFTEADGNFTAPATAAYARLWMTAGDGTGATGSVNFDDVIFRPIIKPNEIGDNSLTATQLAANSVGRSEKVLTQTESNTTISASGTAVLLSGVVAVWSSANLDLQVNINGAWRDSKVDISTNGPATFYSDGTNYRLLNNTIAVQTYYYKRLD